MLHRIVGRCTEGQILLSINIRIRELWPSKHLRHGHLQGEFLSHGLALTQKFNALIVRQCRDLRRET